MIVKAIELRDKENLQKIKKAPGYYKWWANRAELDVILNELTGIEKALLQEYLRILNIRDNNHPYAKEIKKELKRLRKISKNMIRDQANFPAGKV